MGLFLKPTFVKVLLFVLLSFLNVVHFPVLNCPVFVLGAVFLEVPHKSKQSFFLLLSYYYINANILPDLKSLLGHIDEGGKRGT